MVPATKRAGTASSPWGPYLMILPGLAVILTFTVWPMFHAAYLSLFQAKPGSPTGFVGLDNYARVFAAPVFHQVLGNTLLFALGTIPISVSLAMFLALQLNRRWRGTAFFRTLFFYPTVIPMMSAATIWLYLYIPQYGLLARFLEPFGLTYVNLLGNDSTALPAIMAMSVWKDAGYFMIFFLAGLQNLPQDVFEAAELDGASPWQQFWRITFPLLSPTTLFVGTIAAVNAFRTVDQLWLMTSGGPGNATNLLLFHIFEVAFSFFDRGVAATLTVVLVAILLVIALFNNLYVERKVHYE